jgi:UDP-N-acetylmuramoyl-tripeptide--D-alanyl-D-alanine ligase
MKQIAKSIIVSILGWQLRRLRRKNDIKVVAVAGSMGKTSTKFAVASVLGQSFRVRYQEGNYNDLVTVPLVFFGINMPSLFNPLGWLRVLIHNESEIRGEYPYDVVVVELGVDGIGQMKRFKKYLSADIGILTAIAPEHMEYFGSIDAVAKEELVIADIAGTVLLNEDLCPGAYTAGLVDQTRRYGIKKKADFRIIKMLKQADGMYFEVEHEGQPLYQTVHTITSDLQLYSVLAATATAVEFGIPPQQIKEAIHAIKSAPGRMNILHGIHESVIIDDTYNSSPDAAISALESLYGLDAPRRIAILGNMNELGTFTVKAHQMVGEYCDPAKVDLVVTIGEDANVHLAGAAENRGCKVQRFNNPYEAGMFVLENIADGTAVLAKGSQNGVFAEEALKPLLANPDDVKQLVRQSSYWLKKKKKQFTEAQLHRS